MPLLEMYGLIETNGTHVKSLKIFERIFVMNIRDKWNEKHSERLIQKKETAPNPRLESLSDYLSMGTALDLACGLGGNSMFLAQRGYQVQAIDISDVAIDYVREQAAREQLSIDAEVGDLTDMQLTNLYDLIVITYFLDRKLFPIVKNLIKKQGYFFMETYYQSPQNETQKISNQFKLQSNELIAEFKDWNILYFEENEKEGRQTVFCRKL